MSIMDHYGYTTRPLVEFNLSIYTERASFLGWLSHMSERKRLAITLDPASSEPARFKNKRVQASGDMIREESKPEVVPINPPPPQSLPLLLPNLLNLFRPLPINQLKQYLEQLKEKEKLILKMITNLQLKRQKSRPRGALPDLKLVKSPTPVPMEGLLMLEVNFPNIFLKGLEKLQTLTPPRKVREMTEKVIVTLSLTVKCQLLSLGSLINSKIKIL